MMKSFARVTKLSNVAGRADYISNPARQERIVAASEPVDWKPYQEFERAHQKTEAKNNEGREVIVALPNEWAALSRDELRRRAEQVAVTAAGKSTDMQWAVHWNKAHTNLHIHVIFSERQREKNPGVWDRNVYLTADGMVARRKSDRAKDADGKELPPIHRKGEVKEGFTSKDTKYKSREWVASMKEQLRDLFRGYGVNIEQPQPLHEYHEGKGKEAPIIRAKNEAIRANNAKYPEFKAEFPQLREDALKRRMLAAAKDGAVLHLTRTAEGRLAAYTVPLAPRAVDAPKMPLREPEKPQKAPERENAPIPAQQPEKAPEKPQKAPERPKEAEPERQRVYQPQETKADKLRDAYAALRAARAKENDARTEFNTADKLPFWESTKKPRKAAAISKLREAESEGQAAFSSMTELGISKFSDGVELRYSLLSDDDIRSLSREVDRKAAEFDRKDAYEASRAARSVTPEQRKAIAQQLVQEQHDKKPHTKSKSHER